MYPFSLWIIILISSILTISFSLVTSSNAFASQAYESSIGTLYYPDNWEIIEASGNNEAISFGPKISGNSQTFSFGPINESNVYMHKTIYQDYPNGFGRLVDHIIQLNTNYGFETLIRENVTGNIIFERLGTINGIYMVGLVELKQINNYIEMIEYLAESSKYQQYNDFSGFSLYLKDIPDESINQTLIDQYFKGTNMATDFNFNNNDLPLILSNAFLIATELIELNDTEIKDYPLTDLPPEESKSVFAILNPGNLSKVLLNIDDIDIKNIYNKLTPMTFNKIIEKIPESDRTKIHSKLQ
jgi:hypothetical protein